jgi:hypothetical protein
MDEDKTTAAMAREKPSVGTPASGDREHRTTVGASADDAVETTRGVAHQLFGDVRSAAEEMLEERKGRAAESVQGVAHALRRTAGDLKGENEAIARYAEQAADTVERFSSTVRERRFGDMIADLDDFARRQPTLFLVGAIAAGFVTGRFLAATAEREEPSWRVARRDAGMGHRHDTGMGDRMGETPTAGYGRSGGSHGGAG